MDRDTLQVLADKQAIYEVVLRYCRGIDRLDMALVRSAYHPDGIDNHTGFSGPIDGFIAWVEPAVRNFSGTLHTVANHMVELNGDVAVCESYGTAAHWGEPADEPRRNFTTGFRYVDHMTRRGGAWAIQERWAVREWTKSDVGLHVAKWGQGPVGSRGPDDPMTALRSRVGLGPQAR
jgi:hypothetical protein